MRSLALMVAVFSALVACAGEPPASCGALGRVESCACPGGAQGAQECGPLGVWSACVCPGADAGADAPGDAPPPPVDGPAVPEAGADAPEAAADAPAPLDGPREAAADAPALDATAPDAAPDRVCVSMAAANCCGVACQASPNAQPACVAGRCAPDCLGAFGDCDGNAANGCEVDTRTSAAHCGACGAACAANVRCVRGACADCAEGFADCDGDPSNGCEARIGSSPRHCGRCNSPCSRSCVGGVCM